MANVSKLLHNTVDEHFLAKLQADETLLRSARTKIRECLRDAFAKSSSDYFGVTVRPRQRPHKWASSYLRYMIQFP